MEIIDGTAFSYFLSGSFLYMILISHRSFLITGHPPPTLQQSMCFTTMALILVHTLKMGEKKNPKDNLELQWALAISLSFLPLESPWIPMKPEPLFKTWFTFFTWYSEAKNNGFPKQISSRPYNNLNICYPKLSSYLKATCLPPKLLLIFPSNLKYSHPNTFSFFLFSVLQMHFCLLHHNELYIMSLMLYYFFLSLTKAVLPLINPPPLQGPQKL